MCLQQRWSRDNILLHRTDGPAITRYDEDGNIIATLWFIEGNEITIPIKDWLRENNMSAPYSKEDQMAIILRWV